MGRQDLNESVSGLLHRVWAQGGSLTLEGDGLRVRAPFPLPDDLMACLRERKAELIAQLEAMEARPRALYRFRSSLTDEWQYMIAPPSISADEARARCKEAVGHIDEFEPYLQPKHAVLGSNGPHACSG